MKMFPLGAAAACAGLLLCIPVHAQTRGRDPWVFRLVMEDRTGMLVCALNTGLWAAYNTANAGLHRVWSGGMTFRGKVYDFSQNTSISTGTTYHLQEGVLLSALNEATTPAGWVKTGTILESSTAWNFASNQATFTSPALDFSKWERVMLFFDDMAGPTWGTTAAGAAGSFKVQVSTDNGATWAAQEFYSGARKSGWTAAYKRLHSEAAAVKVRFIAPTGASDSSRAQLANVHVDGDYRLWSLSSGGNRTYPQVDWRGHRLESTTSVALLFDLIFPAGRVSVEESPEVITGTNPPRLNRRFTISGLPEGAILSLKIDRASGSLVETWQVGAGTATIRSQAGDQFLDIPGNGNVTLRGTWQ